jgi:hypothetical protein
MGRKVENYTACLHLAFAYHLFHAADRHPVTAA